MAKSIRGKLSQYLKELSEEELRKEILKLYTKFKPIKEFYELELADDTSGVLEAYKAKITKEYIPARGYGRGRSSVSRKVVSDFKKISVFPSDVIELILWRVECMLRYTESYDYIDDAFYISMAKAYEEACKLMAKEGLLDHYHEVCKNLLDRTYPVGWGLHYDFEEVYQGYFA